MGPITFSLNWMFLGLTLSVLGLHGLYMGSLTRIFFDYDGTPDAELAQGVLVHEVGYRQFWLCR